MDFTCKLEQNPGTYHLQTNNCATLAIRAGKIAGFDVPSTEGTFTIPGTPPYTFKGNNHGDLGEDLIQVGGERPQF